MDSPFSCFVAPLAVVRMPNTTLSDIVLSVHCCVECVLEGMKLLHIREKKALSNVQQLVLNHLIYPLWKIRWNLDGNKGDCGNGAWVELDMRLSLSHWKDTLSSQCLFSCFRWFCFQNRCPWDVRDFWFFLSLLITDGPLQPFHLRVVATSRPLL